MDASLPGGNACRHIASHGCLERLLHSAWRAGITARQCLVMLKRSVSEFHKFLSVRPNHPVKAVVSHSVSDY